MLLVIFNIKICKYCTDTNSRSSSRHNNYQQTQIIYNNTYTGFILRYIGAHQIYIVST